MELDLLQVARENPTQLLFLVVGVGSLIGNLRIGQIEVGAITGVLLAECCLAISGCRLQLLPPGRVAHYFTEHALKGD